MALDRLLAPPVLALGIATLAACGGSEDGSVGGSADGAATVAGAPAVGDGDAPFMVDTVQSMVAIACPPVTTPRRVVVEVRNLRNAIIRFEEPGRDHRIWVWRMTGGTRTITMTERTGEDIGVDIHVSGATLPPNKVWGILHLDSSDCPAGYAPGAQVVKVEENGGLTVPEERVDAKEKLAAAALNGNSAYIIATPGPLTGDRPEADPPR